jgi:TRAP-type C4-dicarboxylate transport system permease small subunit
VKPGKRSSRLAEAPHRVSLVLGAAILLVMAAITIAGVFARYVLSRPLAGITELLGEGLMVALIYLSLSSAQHIRVSLIVTRFPPAVRRLVELVVLATVVAVLLVGVYAAYGSAITSYRTGEATTGLRTVPIYPFRFIVMIGLALTVLRVLQLRRRWLQADEFEEALVAERSATAAGERPGPEGHPEREPHV